MMLRSRTAYDGKWVLVLIRPEQLQNPRGATLPAARVVVQDPNVEAFAALEWFGRELLKCQDTAEIHLLESNPHYFVIYFRLPGPLSRSFKQSGD